MQVTESAILTVLPYRFLKTTCAHGFFCPWHLACTSQEGYQNPFLHETCCLFRRLMQQKSFKLYIVSTRGSLGNQRLKDQFCLFHILRRAASHEGEHEGLRCDKLLVSVL